MAFTIGGRGLRYVIIQALAQLVPLAAAPIITRLYTSSQYGALGVFGALSALGFALATGRYQRASLVTPDVASAVVTTRLAIGLAAVFSTTLLAVELATYPVWRRSHWSDLLGWWMFVIPVSVFLMAAYDSLLHFNLKQYLLSRINRAALTMATANNGITIALGVVGLGTSGTLTGSVAAQGVSTGVMARDYRQLSRGVAWKWRDLKSAAVTYANFARYDTPANFALILTYNALPIGLSGIYSASTAGLYLLSYRLLALPADLVGTSVGQLYFRSLSDIKDDRKAALNHLRRTLRLLALSTLPIVVVVPFAPRLFDVIFGSDWRSAGVLVLVLAPHVCARLIATPVFGTFAVYDRQRDLFAAQATLLAVTVGSLGAGAFLALSATGFLLLHSVLASAVYIATLVRVRWLIAAAPGAPEPDLNL